VIHKKEKNEGKGSAIRDGFQLAALPFVVIQDADLEYDPKEYPKLLKPLLEGNAEAVYGSRFLSSGERRAVYFWHRVGNQFLTLLSNMFTNIDLTDMETCYKMMKTPIAKNLKIVEQRFGLEPEITARLSKLDIRIYEVPISYYGRTYDEGKKITWKDGFSAIRCIIKYNIKKS
jgi:glycosyltransferase involved in cell wall biosynthesis